MASATITRPAPGPDPAAGRRSRLRSWPVLALAVLALCTLIGFIVYPTYPNYDSYYSLLWGRELLHGVKPSFDGYRTPTEHPLAVAIGAQLSKLGDTADRHRCAFDKRINDGGSTDGNLNGRGHGYRIPVSCTPR